MVEIGEGCGRKTQALITDMSVPLGSAVGNILEIQEVVDVLRGHGPCDITQICIELAANMLYLAEKGDLITCRNMAAEAIQNGTALSKFAEMIEAQGGDKAYVLEANKLDQAKVQLPVLSPAKGYISDMDTEGIGLCAVSIGAGRQKADDIIDFLAGIIIKAKTGDLVDSGQQLAIIHASSEDSAQVAARRYLDCLTFSDTPVPKPTLIYGN